MKTRYLVLLLVVIITSCKSIKIREQEMDTTQQLVGKIKSMNVTTFRYPSSKRDTMVRKETSLCFFDEKNRVIKQIDSYSKFTEETVYEYKNGLLARTTSNSGDRKSIVEYQYDQKSNLIKYEEFENDVLGFSKTSKFDSNNNKIEEIYLHPNAETLNSIEKFEHDCKNRKVTIRSFDHNNNAKKNYLVFHYDKNGYVTKTQFINEDPKGYSNTAVVKYDKSGNLISRTNIDKNGNPKESTLYKNTYDYKGNIVVREQFSTEKLIEKTTFEIEYR